MTAPLVCTINGTVLPETARDGVNIDSPARLASDCSSASWRRAYAYSKSATAPGSMSPRDHAAFTAWSSVSFKPLHNKSDIRGTSMRRS